MPHMPTLELLEQVARGAAPPLPDADRERIAAAREVVDDALRDGTAVYGVTTGFGQLAGVHIDRRRRRAAAAQPRALARGRRRRRRCRRDVVRGMLFLLARRCGAGTPACAPRSSTCCTALLERGVVPVIPSSGSVGSSGDLAPLAHLALVLVGEGEATVGGSGCRARRRSRAPACSPSS